jgi:HSP20 family molecular chaperone IbpA
MNTLRTNMRSQKNLWQSFDELFNIFNEDFRTSYDIPSDKEFLTELPLPGLDKEHLSIEVSGRTLIVKTNIKNAEGFVKRYVDNSYSYYLSSSHDLSKTEAKMENGLLKIKVPLRKKEETKSVTVEIK